LPFPCDNHSCLITHWVTYKFAIRLPRPLRPPPASWTAPSTARKGQATGRQGLGCPAKTTPGCLPPTPGLGRGLSVGAKRRRGYHGRARRPGSPPPRPLRPPPASWTAPSTARKGQATGRLSVRAGQPAKSLVRARGHGSPVVSPSSATADFGRRRGVRQGGNRGALSRRGPSAALSHPYACTNEPSIPYGRDYRRKASPKHENMVRRLSRPLRPPPASWTAPSTASMPKTGKPCRQSLYSFLIIVYDSQLSGLSRTHVAGRAIIIQSRAGA